MTSKQLWLLVILGSQPLLAKENQPSPWVYEEPSLSRENPRPLGFKMEYGQTQAAGKSSYLSRVGKLGGKYENGLDEVRLNADGSYLRSSGDTIDDRRHAFAGYDRYIGSRLWLFLLADWESNQVAGLNYTQLTGVGVKLDVMRNAVYTLNVGVAYLKRAKQTEYDAIALDDSNQPYVESRLSTKDDKVISVRLKFDYETELTRFALISFYQPVMSKSVDPVSNLAKDDFSWSVESSIAYNLSKQIYLKYVYLFRHEALQTAPGVSRKDEKTMLQIAYEY
jgi:hypothetical protein